MTAVNLPMELSSTLNPCCTTEDTTGKRAALQHLHGFAVMALIEERGEKIREDEMGVEDGFGRRLFPNSPLGPYHWALPLLFLVLHVGIGCPVSFGG